MWDFRVLEMIDDVEGGVVEVAEGVDAGDGDEEGGEDDAEGEAGEDFRAGGLDLLSLASTDARTVNVEDPPDTAKR